MLRRHLSVKILSVDLNSYAQRATLLSPEGELLEHFVAPSKVEAPEWLRKILRTEWMVVGSPLDEWPERAISVVHETGRQVEWLNPSLMRRLYSACRPWNLHRKLHRAHFLGHLFLNRTTPWEADAAAREFEAKVARSLLEQVGRTP